MPIQIFKEIDKKHLAYHLLDEKGRKKSFCSFFVVFVLFSLFQWNWRVLFFFYVFLVVLFYSQNLGN